MSNISVRQTRRLFKKKHTLSEVWPCYDLGYVWTSFEVQSMNLLLTMTVHKSLTIHSWFMALTGILDRRTDRQMDNQKHNPFTTWWQCIKMCVNVDLLLHRRSLQGQPFYCFGFPSWKSLLFSHLHKKLHFFFFYLINLTLSFIVLTRPQFKAMFYVCIKM